MIKYINNQGELKSFRPGWNKGRHVKSDYRLYIDGDYIGSYHQEEEARRVAGSFCHQPDTVIEIKLTHKQREVRKMRYYVTPKDALGYRHTMKDQPVNMTGVDIVDLPAGDYLTVISRGKEYPAHKIALAIAAGQIKIDDVKGV